MFLDVVKVEICNLLRVYNRLGMYVCTCVVGQVSLVCGREAL